MNLEDVIKDLDPELQEKARACGSAEELVALAKDAKVPVPDEALTAIAGGEDPDSSICTRPCCPKCKSRDTVNYDTVGLDMYWRCNNCGYEWTVKIPW